MDNTQTSNGDWTATPAVPDVRLTEPNPFERFRVAMGDGPYGFNGTPESTAQLVAIRERSRVAAGDTPEEIRRKNRASMEAMVTEVG